MPGKSRGGLFPRPTRPRNEQPRVFPGKTCRSVSTTTFVNPMERNLAEGKEKKRDGRQGRNSGVHRPARVSIPERRRIDKVPLQGAAAGIRSAMPPRPGTPAAEKWQYGRGFRGELPGP